MHPSFGVLVAAGVALSACHNSFSAITPLPDAGEENPFRWVPVAVDIQKVPFPERYADLRPTPELNDRSDEYGSVPDALASFRDADLVMFRLCSGDEPTLRRVLEAASDAPPAANELSEQGGALAVMQAWRNKFRFARECPRLKALLERFEPPDLGREQSRLLMNLRFAAESATAPASARIRAIDNVDSLSHHFALYKLAQLAGPVFDQAAFHQVKADDDGAFPYVLFGFLPGHRFSVLAENLNDSLDMRATLGLVNAMLAHRKSDTRCAVIDPKALQDILEVICDRSAEVESKVRSGSWLIDQANEPAHRYRAWEDEARKHHRGILKIRGEEDE
jgi:hypothetical protein